MSTPLQLSRQLSLNVPAAVLSKVEEENEVWGKVANINVAGCKKTDTHHRQALSSVVLLTETTPTLPRVLKCLKLHRCGACLIQLSPSLVTPGPYVAAKVGAVGQQLVRCADDALKSTSTLNFTQQAAGCMWPLSRHVPKHAHKSPSISGWPSPRTFSGKCKIRATSVCTSGA